ncbi:hypothetical protein GWI33_000696 [Rhynchophorus ferrugineus]|uniref:Uncharacterized protein n=1 Tax=Rhynchophorus ferrugineus TaxID=354439 RepID=A0A834HL02_RHYFE|nr:hypothetical protein GWI33_000696 [Rhynchophorus ferrugineus]
MQGAVSIVEQVAQKSPSTVARSVISSRTSSGKVDVEEREKARPFLNENTRRHVVEQSVAVTSTTATTAVARAALKSECSTRALGVSLRSLSLSHSFCCCRFSRGSLPIARIINSRSKLSGRKSVERFLESGLVRLNNKDRLEGAVVVAYWLGFSLLST